MAAPILGIEYSKDSIRIVEVSYARRMKVLNFAVIESGAIPAERRREQLIHTLQTRGFEARQAIIAFSGPNIEHKLLQLPPLSSREMEFVMAREARKVTASKNMLWTYEALESKEEVGIQKSQVLLVTAEAESIKSVQELFAPAKFKIVQVTTVAESLVNLLSNTGVWKKDAVKCVVHLAGNRGHVLFVREGVLLLARDLQFDYTDVSPEEQTGRMITELKRSSLFFRQNFPQANVEEILFSGDNKLLGAIAAAAKQEFGIESGMLRYEDLLDTSGLRGDWDTLRFNLPGLSVALGAAWRKTPGSGINLLPNSKPSSRASAAAGRLAKFLVPASVALVLLSGSYYFAAKSKMDPLRTQLQQKNSEIQAVLAAANAQKLAAERDAAILRLTESKDWTEILRNLSFVIPDSAVFESVQIDKKDKPTVVIRGTIVADINRANGDFTTFLGSLRRIPGIKSVTHNDPSNENRDGQTVIRFEVQCELT
jgi:Tfp pilus assembly PilM family ATPase/Tfp pilus assembly protein PilN